LPAARRIRIGITAESSEWLAAALHFVNGLGPERHRRRISLVRCSVVVMALVEQGDRQNNVLIIAGGTLLARMCGLCGHRNDNRERAWSGAGRRALPASAELREHHSRPEHRHSQCPIYNSAAESTHAS